MRLALPGACRRGLKDRELGYTLTHTHKYTTHMHTHAHTLEHTHTHTHDTHTQNTPHMLSLWHTPHTLA